MSQATTFEQDLSHQEIQRYSRHLIMPEVGIEGQTRLKNSRVLVIGTGGLGSPLAMYLAAAGVGTLGLVDFDVVDASNLQRQIIHSTPDVGKSKLQSAKQTLEGINPNVDIVLHEQAIDSSNAIQIMKDYDIIVDCTDNFPTRYLTNDAAVLLDKPYVYGSIFRFEGQVTVFNYQGGPCYRCLYENPPPPGLVPSCAQAGVFGVLPGIIGTIQAVEVIKMVLGKGEILSNRLLLFDALEMSFKELTLNKNPECVVCSDNPTLTELIDYEEFCGIGEDTQLFDAEFSISLGDMIALPEDEYILVDVREPHELQISKISHAINIPKDLIRSNLDIFDTDKTVIVHCKTGIRSAKVVKQLKNMGYSNVRNLIGGINTYAMNVDPSLPIY